MALLLRTGVPEVVAWTFAPLFVSVTTLKPWLNVTTPVPRFSVTPVAALPLIASVPPLRVTARFAVFSALRRPLVAVPELSSRMVLAGMPPETGPPLIVTVPAMPSWPVPLTVIWPRATVAAEKVLTPVSVSVLAPTLVSVCAPETMPPRVILPPLVTPLVALM